MSENDSSDVHHLLGQLLNTPPADRRRWISEHLADRPALGIQLLASVGDGEPDGAEAGKLGFELSHEVPPATIPAAIGRYQVLERIGSGGMGEVFRARDPNVGRQVAIKLLRKEFNNPELRKRFRQEARAAGNLRHRNLVAVFDIDEYDGCPFIVMEFVPGRTLAEIISRRESISVRGKLAILEGLCEGLECAHRAGVIHRDIKPANIIVDDDGVVKILDFGIAKVLERQSGESLPVVTAEHILIGTMGYIAPEHLAGEPVDPRADIFAVSAVAYELLTGEKPFGKGAAVSRRVLTGDITPMGVWGSDVPPAVEEIVKRGMALSPQDRPATVGLMRAELAALREGLLVRPYDEGKQQADMAPPNKRWIAVPAAIAAVLVVLTVWYTPWRSASGNAAGDPAVAVNSPSSLGPPSAGGSISQPNIASEPSRGGVQEMPPQSVTRSGTRTGAAIVRDPARPSRLVDTTNAPASGSLSDVVSPATPESQPRAIGTLPESTAPVGGIAPPERVTQQTSIPEVSVPAALPAFSAEDETAIRQLLRALESAFEDLSTPELKRVFPSLQQSQLATWERAFLDNQAYRIGISNERMSVLSPARARVDCVMAHSIAPRSGEPRRFASNNSIVFDKVNGEWVISSIRGAGWQ